MVGVRGASQAARLLYIPFITWSFIAPAHDSVGNFYGPGQKWAAQFTSIAVSSLTRVCMCTCVSVNWPHKGLIKKKNKSVSSFSMKVLIGLFVLEGVAGSVKSRRRLDLEP